MSKEVLTKQEECERAQKSILLAEERLSIIDKRLPELETELEELIITNEIRGYKGRTIGKTQAEIDSLQKDKATLNRTVEVLRKKLPDLEKAVRLEVVSTGAVRDYQKAHSELVDLLKRIPSLDPLKVEIERIRQCSKRLEEGQGRFFEILQTLNDFLVRENLQTVGDIDIETLRNNNDQLNYQNVLTLSDDIIDLGEQLNDIQYKLFKTGTAYMPIQEPHVIPVREFSNDKNYYRICEHGTWTLFEKQYKPRKDSAGYEEMWMPRDSGKLKPEFPVKPEFSPCGKFRIEKGVSRWKLFQKDDE